MPGGDGNSYYQGGGKQGVLGAITGAQVHAFGADLWQNEVIRTARWAALEWPDPWGAARNDYDLFLVDSAGRLVDSSTWTQDGGQDPIEFIGEVGQGERLVVVKVADADRYLRVSAPGGALAIATAGNVGDHAGAEMAIAVGAVIVAHAGGADGVFDGTESVATNSSDGPRRIFFEPDGAPVTRGDFSATGGRLVPKPDIVAATCVATSTPGFARFCGTPPRSAP